MQRYAANVPSVGLVTFMRSPVCEDFSKIDADVAVLGIPYDAGIGFRPGTRFGPREIRNYSVRYSGWGSWKGGSGYWDINTKKKMMQERRMVDCGDVDIAYYDIERNMRLMTDAASAIVARNALPVFLGGDHSVTFPLVKAFEKYAPLDIVHFDAHMDWIDHVDGIKFANGSPLRRVKELPFVRKMVHLGIRDLRSRESDVADAIKAGAQIFTREMVREQGTKAILEQMPQMNNIYVSIDIDGLDPSIAPGTGSPTVDGLLYHEVRALLQGVAKKGKVVGMDVVEVNPFIDLHGQTCLLTTTMIAEFLGAIFDQPR